jgi:hypothetical protein
MLLTIEHGRGVKVSVGGGASPHTATARSGLSTPEIAVPALSNGFALQSCVVVSVGVDRIYLLSGIQVATPVEIKSVRTPTTEGAATIRLRRGGSVSMHDFPGLYGSPCSASTLVFGILLAVVAR